MDDVLGKILRKILTFYENIGKKILSDTLAKISHFFFNIQNIIRIFYLKKKVHFLAAGVNPSAPTPFDVLPLYYKALF